MKPLKNKVSITLDSDIIEQLKLLAEQDDRSFSGQKERSVKHLCLMLLSS